MKIYLRYSFFFLLFFSLSEVSAAGSDLLPLGGSIMETEEISGLSFGAGVLPAFVQCAAVYILYNGALSVFNLVSMDNI